MPGRVTLIGAGPGDPGLITAKGLDRLRQADVVVYDALVNPRLLDEAKPGARLVYVGKRGGESSMSQDRINSLLLKLARDGQEVARLKGGDPYLFGRGAEEVTFLSEHGISCEVIPGVTSGVAAPAYAGIPVTHRQYASTVTFVTGHEDPTKPGSSVDYRALADLIRAGGTACFYMGVRQLPRIVADLIRNGLAGETPSAVVQWGTMPKQRVARGPLEQLPAEVEAQGIGSPAIIVVGPVAGLEAEGLDFFSRRPLSGQTIVVTRARQQASELAARLEELGADVLQAPTIRFEPLDDWSRVDATIRSIGQYDWLVLTSVQGVTVLADRLQALGRDARHLAGVRVASVGDATSRALRQQLAVVPDLQPTSAMGEALGRALVESCGDLSGQRVLLLRADVAGRALPKVLSEAGAEVTDLPAYRTLAVEGLPGEVLGSLQAKTVDWVTFTSGSTVRNLVSLLGGDVSLLSGVKTASIGPMTSEAMREAGLVVTVEADRPGIEGMVRAILARA